MPALRFVSVGQQPLCFVSKQTNICRSHSEFQLHEFNVLISAIELFM